MLFILIFSGSSSTDNGNETENEVNDFLQAFKSKNFVPKWSIKSEIAPAYFSVEVTLYCDEPGK